MTELEFLRLQVRGIPVHTHKSAKRGEWFCKSPYCVDLTDEAPIVGPNESASSAARYDMGSLSA